MKDGPNKWIDKKINLNFRLFIIRYKSIINANFPATKEAHMEIVWPVTEKKIASVEWPRLPGVPVHKPKQAQTLPSLPAWRKRCL
jgi:hypothetical protein